MSSFARERVFFFFNDTATTEISSLSLHDALPISWLQHPSPSATSSVPPVAISVVPVPVIVDALFHTNDPSTSNDPHTSDLHERSGTKWLAVREEASLARFRVPLLTLKVPAPANGA